MTASPHLHSIMVGPQLALFLVARLALFGTLTKSFLTVKSHATVLGEQTEMKATAFMTRHSTPMMNTSLRSNERFKPLLTATMKLGRGCLISTFLKDQSNSPKTSRDLPTGINVSTQPLA